VSGRGGTTLLQQRAPRSCTVFVMTPPNEHTSEGGRDDRGVPYHAEPTLSTSSAQVLKHMWVQLDDDVAVLRGSVAVKETEYGASPSFSSSPRRRARSRTPETCRWWSVKMVSVQRPALGGADAREVPLERHACAGAIFAGIFLFVGAFVVKFFLCTCVSASAHQSRAESCLKFFCVSRCVCQSAPVRALVVPVCCERGLSQEFFCVGLGSAPR